MQFFGSEARISLDVASTVSGPSTRIVACSPCVGLSAVVIQVRDFVERGLVGRLLPRWRGGAGGGAGPLC